MIQAGADEAEAGRKREWRARKTLGMRKVSPKLGECVYVYRVCVSLKFCACEYVCVCLND